MSDHNNYIRAIVQLLYEISEFSDIEIMGKIMSYGQDIYPRIAQIKGDLEQCLKLNN